MNKRCLISRKENFFFETSSVVERDLPSLTEDLKMYCLSTEDLLFGFRSYCFGQRGYCFENDQQ